MKKILLIAFILFISLGAFAITYPDNFSFEDYNFQNFKIDQNINSGAAFPRGVCNNGALTCAEDRGWDVFDGAVSGNGCTTPISDANNATIGTRTYRLIIGSTGAGGTCDMMPSRTNLDFNLAPGETRVFCVDATISYGVNGCGMFVISVDGNQPSVSSSDNASRVTFNTGSPKQISVRQYCAVLTNNKSDSRAPIIGWGQTTSCGSGVSNDQLWLDRYYSEGPFSITSVTGNTLFDANRDSNILVELRWDSNNELLKDANVALNFTSPVFAASRFVGVFNSTLNKYVIQIDGNTLAINGNYNFTIDANRRYMGPNALTDSYAGTITTSIPEYRFVTFTPLSNVASFRYGSIEITPSTENQDITFRLDNNATNDTDVNLLIFNSLEGGEQYFVYTANEGQYQAGTWVFNDTLTFGSSSSYDDPVQKIWDPTNNRYVYQFVDTLGPSERKYYKLAYRSPIYFFPNFDENWFNQLAPFSQLLGDKNVETFSVNPFSNMRSYLIESLPLLVGDINRPYEIQFTARVDKNTSATLSIVDYDLNSNTDVRTKNVTLSAGFHTYSVDFLSSQYESKVLLKTAETYPKNITIYDVRIVERAYFSKRLKVTDEFDQEFPALALSGVSRQYILENQKAKLSTAAQDRDGNLTEIDYLAYFDTNADVNVARKLVDTIDSSEGALYSFEKIFDGLVDLTSNGPNRDLIYRAQLVDSNGNAVAIQSKRFKFLQWPYFPKDLEIGLNVFNSTVGNNPAGHFSIFSSNPENITGIKFYIIDQNSTIGAPNYQKTFYKGTDFSCNGDDCSFDFSILDWVYPSENRYLAEMVILTPTQNFAIPLDPNLVRIVYYTVSKKQLTALRITEIFPRECYNSSFGWICDAGVFAGTRNFKEYRSYEKVPLRLQIRAGSRENLKDNMIVKINLVKCLNGGTCSSQATDPTNYYPDSYSYDDINGNNYWYFNQGFPIAQDGNFYRVLATVTDQRNQYTIPGNAVLTVKAKPDLTYAPDTNTISNEYLLKITDTNTARGPTVLGHYCVAYDQNVFLKRFDDVVLNCGIFYRMANAIPDKMTVHIGNSFSDYSETNPAYQQFIQFDLGSDVFEASDIEKLKSLADNTGTTCTTIGCLIQVLSVNQGALKFQNASGAFESISPTDIVVSDFLDFNYNEPLDNFTSELGWIGYTVRGVNVLNTQDFDSLSGINPKTAVKYAIQNNLSFVHNTRPVDIYVNGEKVKSFSTTATLVVNQARNSQGISSLDQNTNGKINGPLPVTFSLTSIYDIFYNYELSSVRKVINVKVRLQYPNTNPDLFAGITKLFGGFTSTGVDLINDPIQWVKDNIVTVVIALMLIITLAWIYSQFKGGQTINFNSPPGR